MAACTRPPGFDAVVLLRADAGPKQADGSPGWNGVLTMPLASAVGTRESLIYEGGSAGGRWAAQQGVRAALRESAALQLIDLRRTFLLFATCHPAVTGCFPGTAGSVQDGLELPPIYFAVRDNYSEPTSQPPPQTEEERPLPDTCDPQDPKQASLAFPWSAVFTFYTYF